MTISNRIVVPRRVRRFFAVLGAKPLGSTEAALLRDWLAEPQLALFRRMELADQRHCLKVFEILRRDGWEDRDLLQAALLHDCGKAEANLSVWHRVLIDVLRWRSPRLLCWLSRRAPRPLAEPLRVGLAHDEIGAAAARRAGCSERAVALVRGARGGRDGSLMSQALALELADGAE